MKRFLSKRNIQILNGILLSAILIHSVLRDIQMNNMFPEDLRNRVVGSRLQKDKIIPYTYHWQPGDGIRYFDPINESVNSTGVNNITASPFFHELLFSICDLPQRAISIIWLVLQYIFLTVMIILFTGLTTNHCRKWLLINFGILFTLTEAWKTGIGCGQHYFFIGFLIACITACLIRNKKPVFFLAGLLAAVFVLTRPIAIVLFIPYLYDYKKHLIFLSVSFAVLTLYTIFIFINPYENALYKNYMQSMVINVQNHYIAYQGLGLHVISVAADPGYSEVEGFNMAEVYKNRTENKKPFYTENGNIFVIYEKITHRKITWLALNLLSASTILLLSVLFFIRLHRNSAREPQVVLFGFVLYLMLEICLPIFRNQYNTVQWFPLVLTGLLLTTKWQTVPFLLLITGLLLNISNLSWLPMRHTLGEFAWLLSLLLLVFTSPRNQNTGLSTNEEI